MSERRCGCCGGDCPGSICSQFLPYLDAEMIAGLEEAFSQRPLLPEFVGVSSPVFVDEDVPVVLAPTPFVLPVPKEAARRAERTRRRRRTSRSAERPAAGWDQALSLGIYRTDEEKARDGRMTRSEAVHMRRGFIDKGYYQWKPPVERDEDEPPPDYFHAAEFDFSHADPPERYRFDPDRPCKRCGRWSLGDDFCSRTCAEVFFGVVSEDEMAKRRNTRRRILRDDRQPWVEAENPSVNRERHDGPGAERIRRVG